MISKLLVYNMAYWHALLCADRTAIHYCRLFWSTVYKYRDHIYCNNKIEILSQTVQFIFYQLTAETLFTLEFNWHLLCSLCARDRSNSY